MIEHNEILSGLWFKNCHDNVSKVAMTKKWQICHVVIPEVFADDKKIVSANLLCIKLPSTHKWNCHEIWTHNKWFCVAYVHFLQLPPNIHLNEYPDYVQDCSYFGGERQADKDECSWAMPPWNATEMDALDSTYRPLPLLQQYARKVHYMCAQKVWGVK